MKLSRLLLSLFLINTLAHHPILAADDMSHFRGSNPINLYDFQKDIETNFKKIGLDKYIEENVINKLFPGIEFQEKVKKKIMGDKKIDLSKKEEFFKEFSLFLEYLSSHVEVKYPSINHRGHYFNQGIEMFLERVIHKIAQKMGILSRMKNPLVNSTEIAEIIAITRSLAKKIQIPLSRPVRDLSDSIINKLAFAYDPANVVEPENPSLFCKVSQLAKKGIKTLRPSCHEVYNYAEDEFIKPGDLALRLTQENNQIDPTYRKKEAVGIKEKYTPRYQSYIEMVDRMVKSYQMALENLGKTNIIRRDPGSYLIVEDYQESELPPPPPNPESNMSPLSLEGVPPPPVSGDTLPASGSSHVHEGGDVLGGLTLASRPLPPPPLPPREETPSSSFPHSASTSLFQKSSEEGKIIHGPATTTSHDMSSQSSLEDEDSEFSDDEAPVIKKINSYEDLLELKSQMRHIKERIREEEKRNDSDEDKLRSLNKEFEDLVQKFNQSKEVVEQILLKKIGSSKVKWEQNKFRNELNKVNKLDVDVGNQGTLGEALKNMPISEKFMAAGNLSGNFSSQKPSQDGEDSDWEE